MGLAFMGFRRHKTSEVFFVYDMDKQKVPQDVLLLKKIMVFLLRRCDEKIQGRDIRKLAIFPGTTPQFISRILISPVHAVKAKNC